MPTYGTILNISGPGTGPVDPHTNGVAGATHRWIPSLTTLADGVTFPSIEDVIGTLDLTPSTAASPPGRVATQDGFKRVRFDNGHGGKYFAPQQITGAFTFAAVMKSTALSLNAFVADGYRLQRATGGYMLAGDNGSGGSGLKALTGTDNTVVIMGMANGTSSRVRLNDTVSTDAGTITGPSATYDGQIYFGPDNSGINAGTFVDVLEANFWPFILDTTQQAAHVAAMRAHYGSTVIP